MVTISDPLVAESADYYVKYYKKHTKAPGVWFGEGITKLSLRVRVKDEDFRSLLLGYHPRSGKPLVQNAGYPDRQAGWDITFSAPKSVSVLWSLLPKRKRRMIERAHTAAIKDALALLQKIAGVTRRGKGGRRIEKAAIAFALFLDHTSRALDPQLHTHAILFNLSLREDGTTGTIRSKDVFKLKMILGQCYRDSFEKRLSEIVEVTREAQEFAFRVKGVPQSLCDAASKRRHEIEVELERLGKKDAVSAKKAALATRRTAKDASLEVLFKEWRRIGEAHGFGEDEALSLFRRKERTLKELKASAQHLLKKDNQSERREGAPNQSESFERSESGRSQGTEKSRSEEPDPTKPKRESESLSRFIGGHFFHIRTYKITLPFDPLRAKGSFWKKRDVRIPYIAFGPRSQRWGFIRKRLRIGKFGEFRVQERLLFPRTPFVRKFFDVRLPALRWRSYKDLERDAEWAVRRGLRPEFEDSLFSKDRAFKSSGSWQNGRMKQDKDEERNRSNHSCYR